MVPAARQTQTASEAQLIWIETGERPSSAITRSERGLAELMSTATVESRCWGCIAPASLERAQPGGLQNVVYNTIAAGWSRAAFLRAHQKPGSGWADPREMLMQEQRRAEPRVNETAPEST